MLFIIHAIDKPDSSLVRQANRDKHLEYLVPFELPVAGPLLNSDGGMTGSCLFLETSDLASAQEFAANDPYALAGLFESVSIHEFKKVRWP